MSSPPPLLPGEETGQRTAGREWRLQLVGWAGMALVVVLALLGLFGAGPLSWSRATAADGSLEVEYQRFVRNGGDNTLSLQVPASAVGDGEARVWVSNEHLGNIELSQIVPEPGSQVAESGGVVLVFDVADAADRLEITITATGNAIGLQHARLALAGGPPVDFWQLYYP